MNLIYLLLQPWLTLALQPIRNNQRTLLLPQAPITPNSIMRHADYPRADVCNLDTQGSAPYWSEAKELYLILPQQTYSTQHVWLKCPQVETLHIIPNPNDMSEQPQGDKIIPARFLRCDILNGMPSLRNIVLHMPVVTFWIPDNQDAQSRPYRGSMQYRIKAMRGGAAEVRQHKVLLNPDPARYALYILPLPQVNSKYGQKPASTTDIIKHLRRYITPCRKHGIARGQRAQCTCGPFDAQLEVETKCFGNEAIIERSPNTVTIVRRFQCLAAALSPQGLFYGLTAILVASYLLLIAYLILGHAEKQSIGAESHKFEI